MKANTWNFCMHLPKCFIFLPCHYCPSFTAVCLFFLAIPVANWSASIENTTTTSIRISWQNLTPVLGRRILHYFVVIKSSNGSILNGNEFQILFWKISRGNGQYNFSCDFVIWAVHGLELCK